MSRANVIATIVFTTVWVLFTLITAVISVMVARKASRWRNSVKWALALGLFGVAAVLLYLPWGVAGVGVYNVVPYTTPYPDDITPNVLLLGWASIAAAIVLAILAARLSSKARTALVAE